MAPIPPSSPITEQRLLAAIVFTDVAGFSARVHAEETKTLVLLERDFAIMREASEALSGSVLKTTGDGLLLCFTSAVHAVSWALKVQRHFAAQARELPADEVLRHRVGVHVGDIFVTADDIMGDGVNIAARVQNEAPAGGICISQGVYDVVRNKMKLDVVRLEPRKLKNIAEILQMYHLLLEPRPVAPIESAPVPRVPLPVEQPPAAGGHKFVMITLVVVGMALVGARLVQAYFEHERELQRSQTSQAALGALLTEKQKTQRAAAPEPPERAAVEQFDFTALTTNVPRSASTNAAEDRAFQEAQQCIQTLNTWFRSAFRGYTATRPLAVKELREGATRSWIVFTDPSGEPIYAEGSAIRPRTWSELKPEDHGAIIVSTLTNALTWPPREVVRGAEAFAYVHGLTQMAAILKKARETRGAPAP